MNAMATLRMVEKNLTSKSAKALLGRMAKRAARTTIFLICKTKEGEMMVLNLGAFINSIELERYHCGSSIKN